MKTLKTCLSALFISLMLSCKDKEPARRSETECLPARFISTYCPANEPLYVVQFLAPTALAAKQESDHYGQSIYVAALADLPASVQKIDTTFYIRFHHDPARESSVKLNYCPAIFSILPILVTEGVSSDACQ